MSASKIGCIFVDRIINHIAYADDLIVFSPSSKGLQSLVKQCELFVIANDINYNQKKTVGMLIKPCHSKCDIKCDIVLNGQKLTFVDKYKYLGIIVIY